MGIFSSVSKWLEEDEKKQAEINQGKLHYLDGKE